MRKLLVRSIIPIMLLIFLSFSVYSQINCVPVFTAEYKSSGGIEPYDIKELSDGNFIVAGRGKTLPNTLYHGMVTKINTTGDVLWSFLLDGSSETGLQAITLLSNGDYLLHGIIYETGYPEGKPLVIRIASNGTIIWSRMIAANGIGKDRIKSMQELPGGDFIGTMNQNDSSAQSDPIVFRMTNTGTLQWTHRFDHGGDDSFTSIAFDGGIVYAAGFYSTTFKRGVIVKLTENGDFISAVTQSVRNDMDEEVVSIEVNNNIISFGVRATTADFCNVSFVQKDMQGKKLFQRLSALGDDVTFMKVTRTPDQGFMVLRSYSTVNPVEVTKISRYGASQWGAAVSFNGIQQNYAMDFTSDGGVVTAGHYRDELSGTMLMRATKTDKAGFGGDCVKRGGGVFTDTVTVFESGFDWKEKNLTDDLLINPAAVSRDNFTLNKDEKCKESVCVDGTPLPPGCGKTYRIEYGSDKSMYFRDVISAPDGGKLAVGSIFATEIAEDGLVVKLNMNGDVAWSRSYEEFFHNMYLTRILRSADNNYFIFANNKYIFSNWIYHSLAIIKINDQGNVLWSKNLQYREFSQIVDAVSTPDNGFVVAINDSYTSPPMYGQLLRFDADGNNVWKKNFNYDSYNVRPEFESITCNEKAIYVTNHDHLSSPKQTFGVHKFSLATGDKIWSRKFRAEGDNIMVRINKVFSINDSAYVFLDYFVNAGFGTTFNTVLVKLDPDGNIADKFMLHTSPIVRPEIFPKIDESPPSVVLTPNFDFVLANRIIDENGNKSFNISRFLRNGTQVWSKNFSSLGQYSPFNIHSQGNGVIITGLIDVNAPNFEKGFIIKADSAGRIEQGADCIGVNAVIQKSDVDISSFGEIIVTVSDADLTIKSSEILNQPEAVDATQFCHNTGPCGNVGFMKKESGCSLTDTLVYYLIDPQNCDAAATWQYDPSFFKMISVDAYTLNLVPLQKGVSSVKAVIEGNCSISEKIIPTSVLIAANEMTLGNDTVLCNNQQVKLSAGPGYANYHWNNNSSDSVLVVSSPGIYAVTVTDNCGISYTDSIEIKDAQNTFNLIDDTTKCNNETLLLTATAGLNNYEWYPQYHLQSSNNNAFVTPDDNTTYFVKAISPLGCIIIDSAAITVIRTPGIFLGGDTSICSGASYNLDAGNNFDIYLWSTGQTTNTITVNQKGVYTVKAFKDGCYSYDTLVVREINPLPAFTLGRDTTICKGMQLILDPKISDPGAVYKWQDQSNSSFYTVTREGLYTVMVKNQCGAGVDSIWVSSGICSLMMPDAFTPGNDGLNDIYRVRYVFPVKWFSFSIFNRWGQKVFETNDINKGWDGRYNGNPEPTAVFVWKISFEDLSGNKQNASGIVTLIR